MSKILYAIMLAFCVFMAFLLGGTLVVKIISDYEFQEEY